MTPTQKRTEYTRWYCNAKGEPCKGVAAFDELDDEDFERLATLSGYQDDGARVVIPGINA